MAGLKFVIPEVNKKKFKRYYDVMREKCPLACDLSQINLNESSGMFSISVPKNMSNSQKKFCLQALKEVNALPVTDKLIAEQVKLLEKVTKNKVKLVENNDANKNLTVKSLKAVSETLDMLLGQVQEAITQVQQLSGQDVILTKLHGLSSIVEASQTDVSQAITDVTGLQTSEDYIDDQPTEQQYNQPSDEYADQDKEEFHEDDSDPKGVMMDMDNAVKDINDVAKFVDKGQNVIIDDDINK